MTRIERTDCHCPKNIKPEDYEYVACEYIKIECIGDCYFMMEMRRRIREHMARTGGTYSRHEHGGNCHICGAHAIYTILFYHAPTNSYIRTGGDCADKLGMSCGDYNAFRAAVRDALEAKAGLKKAKATLEAAGLAAAWDVYMDAKEAMDGGLVTDDGFRPSWPERFEYEERTIYDIVGKLIKCGSVSEKTMDFVHDLVERIAHRPTAEEKARIEAAKAAELAKVPDVPEGRLYVCGEVLSTRVDHTDFGMVKKMLVKSDLGFKVWCTCVGGAEKGDMIDFVATLTRSDRDPKFGFGSRPTCCDAKCIELEKAVKINAAPAEIVPGDFVLKSARKIVDVFALRSHAEYAAEALRATGVKVEVLFVDVPKPAVVGSVTYGTYEGVK